MINIFVGYLGCVAAYACRNDTQRFWYRCNIALAIINFTAATAVEIIRTL